MPDAHGLIVRIAKRIGVVTGGIHERLSAQEHCWDATIFKGQDVVHTARHARASIADRRYDEVAAFGQLVDDSGLRDARINELGSEQSLCHAVLGTQSRGDVFQ
jgi:hypothetical protein